MKTGSQKEFFTTGDVAKILGLNSHNQARYWLKREGALRKRGSRYYTTRALLMSAFPEVFQALGR
jgi:hypothetical protein